MRTRSCGRPRLTTSRSWPASTTRPAPGGREARLHPAVQRDVGRHPRCGRTPSVNCGIPDSCGGSGHANGDPCKLSVIQWEDSLVFHDRLWTFTIWTKHWDIWAWTYIHVDDIGRRSPWPRADELRQHRCQCLLRSSGAAVRRTRATTTTGTLRWSRARWVGGTFRGTKLPQEHHQQPLGRVLRVAGESATDDDDQNGVVLSPRSCCSCSAPGHALGGGGWDARADPDPVLILAVWAIGLAWVWRRHDPRGSRPRLSRRPSVPLPSGMEGCRTSQGSSAECSGYVAATTRQGLTAPVRAAPQPGRGRAVRLRCAMRFHQVDEHLHRPRLRSASHGRGAWSRTGIGFDYRYALAPDGEVRIGQDRAVPGALGGRDRLLRDPAPADRPGRAGQDHQVRVGRVQPRHRAGGGEVPGRGPRPRRRGRWTTTAPWAARTPGLFGHPGVREAYGIPDHYLLREMYHESQLDPARSATTYYPDYRVWTGIARISKANGSPGSRPSTWASQLVRAARTFRRVSGKYPAGPTDPLGRRDLLATTVGRRDLGLKGVPPRRPQRRTCR